MKKMNYTNIIRYENYSSIKKVEALLEKSKYVNRVHYRAD